MKGMRYFNPWLFGLVFTLFYSVFIYWFFFTLNPEGTPGTLESLLYFVSASLLALGCVYAAYRTLRPLRSRMSTGTFYFAIFALSFLYFLVAYSLYWGIVIRMLVYKLTTTVSMMWRESRFMLGCMHTPISIATLLGLYNEKVYQLNQDILLKERMLSEARLVQLQQQVDPHFLFNNLNILSALIRPAPERAEIFTHRLSELYRYYLRSGAQPLVFLQDELRFMENYMYLLEARFDAAFQVNVSPDCQAAAGDVFLVAGTLQLLLENVVKHNAAAPDDPLHISISLHGDTLVVENPVRKKEALSEGIGLINLEKRYLLLTGKQLQHSAGQESFRVAVPLIKQLKQLP